MPEPKPEDLYCTAETEAERLRLRTAVVAAYGGHVRVAARRLVPLRYMEDAYQAGMMGLLDALNKFDPGRGAPFWAYAALWVRNAIQAWQDAGQYDCRAPNRGKGEAFEARRETVRARRYYERDASEPGHSETPEQLVSMKEQLRILSEIGAELSSDDRALLFSENGQDHRSDHYQSLVAKAAAKAKAPSRAALERIRGNDGSGRAVHDNRDTVRP